MVFRQCFPRQSSGQAGQVLRQCSGQVLAELLIAIAVAVILVAVGAQLVGVSLDAVKTSSDQTEAIGLAQEALEAVRVIVRSNDATSQGWNKLYLPPDGTGTASSSKGVENPHQVRVVGNAWELATGTEAIVLGAHNYARHIVIENVSRDPATDDIQTIYDVAYDDPSTQKVIAVIAREGTQEVTLTAYFTRYLNEVLPQADWSGAISDGPFPATSTVPNPGTGTDGAGVLDRTNGNCSGSATCVRLEPQ